MSWGTSGPSTRASPARTRSPPWTRRYLPWGTRCSRSMQLPLVLHDRPTGVARRVDLDPHRLVLDDVLEADLAADLGEDRDVVRVPLAEHRAAGDLLAVLDLHLGAVGDVVLLQLAPLDV